jgi:cytochrome c oxidase subunit IV
VGALIYPQEWTRMPLNIFVIVMSLLKAWYIVGVFMHLKYEVMNLIATVLFPLVFLVWAIIAFLWEGDWYGHAQAAGLFDWML